MSAIVRPTAFLTALTAAVVLAACAAERPPALDTASSPEPASAQPAKSTPTETAQEHDLAAFCLAAAPMLVAVEREFIGSEAHVQQFRDLAEAAPEDLLSLIDTMQTHYDLNVSPANPDSQDFVNFPAGVQRAALDLDAALRERC